MSGPRSLTVCAVILAAGESKRFGPENKLLAKVEGVPILERVVKAVIGIGVAKTIVVTGEDHQNVSSLLSEYQLEFIQNKNWRHGMGSSMAIGVGQIEEEWYDGILICLGDLPYLSSVEVQQLLQTFCEDGGKSIVVPEIEGRRGHPVVFPISYRSEIMLLTGDSGAKDILKEARENLMLVPVDSFGIFKDIDKRSDLDNETA